MTLPQPHAPSAKLRWLDLGTRVAGGLCALHCALVPLLFVFVPAMRVALHSFNSEHRDLAMFLLRTVQAEQILIVTVVITTLVGLGITRAPWQAWLMRGSGLAILLTGAFILGVHLAWAHAALLIMGGALLWLPLRLMPGTTAAPHSH